MLEKRLAKMEEILLSPDEGTSSKKAALTEEEEDDYESESLEFIPTTASTNNKNSKRSSEDSNHDCTSPTSFSSISSNFPSPPAHLAPSKSDDILPSYDVIEHIVDLYFKYLFSALPLFHEETLRSQIKERNCSDFLLLSLLGACAR